MLQNILLSALRKKETRNAFLSSNAFELNPSSFCIQIQFKCKINSLQSLTFLLKLFFVYIISAFRLHCNVILNSLKRKTDQTILWFLIFCILCFSKCNTYINAKKITQKFLHIILWKSLTEKRTRRLAVPERIYNSHYGNAVPAMFTSQCCPAEG